MQHYHNKNELQLHFDKMNFTWNKSRHDMKSSYCINYNNNCNKNYYYTIILYILILY